METNSIREWLKQIFSIWLWKCKYKVQKGYSFEKRFHIKTLYSIHVLISFLFNWHAIRRKWTNWTWQNHILFVQSLYNRKSFSNKKKDVKMIKSETSWNDKTWHLLKCGYIRTDNICLLFQIDIIYKVSLLTFFTKSHKWKW